MSQILFRLLQVAEVLLIYQAIKRKYASRQEDAHADTQQQHQADTCEPTQHPRQRQERRTTPPSHDQDIHC